jgi:uncharacterized protein YfaQ (DUF2300 family)
MEHIERWSRFNETATRYGGWLVQLADGRQLWLYDNGTFEEVKAGNPGRGREQGASK